MPDATMPAYVQSPDYRELHRRFPTTAWLRQQAPRRVPRFAFDYGDSGAGSDIGIAHNWAALDAIKVVPRYGIINTLPPLTVELD